MMAICCEDDEHELHRRLACITDRLGGRSSISILAFNSRQWRDARLFSGVPDGRIIVPTPLFKELSEQAISIRPKLIVIDNAADVYGGDENSTAMVRQFITLLRELAIDSGAAVCSHSTRV